MAITEEKHNLENAITYWISDGMLLTIFTQIFTAIVGCNRLPNVQCVYSLINSMAAFEISFSLLGIMKGRHFGLVHIFYLLQYDSDGLMNWSSNLLLILEF